jgi:hypothetical protein
MGLTKKFLKKQPRNHKENNYEMDTKSTKSDNEKYNNLTETLLPNVDILRSTKETVSFDASLHKDYDDKIYHKKSSGTLRTMKKGFSNVIRPVKGVRNLAIYYLVFKLINLLNIIFQLLAMRWIFGKDFVSYGFDFVSKVWNGHDMLFLSKQFPIVTFCDFYVHQNLRQIHGNSAQCLLPINIFIEKFYVIIW